MSRLLLCLVPLVLVYGLVLASAAPADIVIGAALAGLLLWGTRGYLFGGSPPPLVRPARRLVGFVPFAAAALGEVLRGTWEVALVVLHVRPLRHPGIVAVPIGERTPLGVAVTALVDTLSPGSCLIDVDWERRTILLHVLNASDPDAIRSAHQRFYRRYQRHVFP